MGSRKRILAFCAEDTPEASNACQWLIDQVYREGDVVHFIYVITSLKPPMEVFHGLPGTAYKFQNPGDHNEISTINAARKAIEDRFLPILKPLKVPYEFNLYAEKEGASPECIGRTVLKCVDELLHADIVALSAHNSANDADAFMGKVGSVANFMLKNCRLPLAVVRPPFRPKM